MSRELEVYKLLVKCIKVAGVVQSNLYASPRSVRETAYNTLVQPTLEYRRCRIGSLPRGGYSKAKRVQRKAAPFCTGNYNPYASVTKMPQELNWEALATCKNPTDLLCSFIKSQKHQMLCIWFLQARSK